MILALDLSTNTGWASFSSETGIRSGVFKIEGGTLGEWAEDFTTWIAPKLIGVTNCFIEEMILPSQTQLETMKKLGYLQGAVAEACHRRRIRCQTVPQGTWRVHFIGTGAAPKGTPKGKGGEWLKKRALEKCAERGWKPRRHDEAEALGILDYARSLLDPSYGVASTPLFRSI